MEWRGLSVGVWSAHWLAACGKAHIAQFSSLLFSSIIYFKTNLLIESRSGKLEYPVRPHTSFGAYFKYVFTNPIG